MFHLIWVLIIGGIIGAIAGAITSRRLPAGWVGNSVAGIIGSYLGELLLGNWGPQIAGMAVFPSIIGAIILVVIVSLILGLGRKES